MERQCYLVISDLTGRPYITKERVAVAFELPGGAEGYASRIENVHISPQEDMGQALMESCYRAGADSIRYMSPSGNEDILLDDSLGRAAYCNRRLCADLALVRHYQDREAFHDLASCRYILPGRVTGSPSIRITFAALYNKERTERIYIAFSSLDTFYAWSSSVKGWEPLEVDFRTLVRTCGEYGAAIDPQTAMFVIGQAAMAKLV